MSAMGSERDILKRLRAQAGVPKGGLALGIGDDCAIYQPRADEELVFTTDFFIENVHFRRETHGPRDIGYKALARGLSDLAAMGAVPRFCLFSLAIPAQTPPKYVDLIFSGLLNLSTLADCPLAGGDLSSAALIVCDILACGGAPRGSSLRRSGARLGDAIWVSGELGGSALGLKTNRGAARRRHLRPEPRLALGRALRNKATAAMDLSDGLSIDLARLCAESGVAAEIGPPPAFRAASKEQALHGGEDYELLFTTGPRTRLPAVLGGVRVTRIGKIVAGIAGEVRLDGELLPALGYDHFR